MNEHFKDQMLVAITSEIQAHRRSAAEPSRVPAKALLAAAAVLTVVAGGLAIAAIDGPDTVSVATDDTSPTTTSNPDAAFERGFVFGTPHGKTFLVPASDPMREMAQAPSYPDGYVAFRLADADPRIAPMTVSPSIDTFETHVVETIGSREIRTPNGMGYPAGTTEATSSGPWFWTESDGTKWMASGLLPDLRRALPDLAYVDGALVPGSSLVRVDDTPAPIKPELHRVRDERFEFGVSDDSTSTFDFIDPTFGPAELVDINGRPGILTRGEYLSWRIDDHTVGSLQRSMASFGGAGPTSDEVLEAARSIRPATSEEMRALPPWRGTVDERVIVTIPESVRDEQFIGVRLADLDDPTNGGWITFNIGVVPYEHGFAVPLGADRIGHRLELRLDLNDGVGRCPVTVTVPPEGADPVTIHLEANC